MGSITKRLTLYFSVVLIMFALVIGFIFTGLFTRNVIDANKTILTNNANQIADSLAEYLQDESNNKRSSRHMMGNRNELNSFIKIIDEISVGEVWLVDNRSIITRGMHSSKELEKEISNEGIRLIDNALNGLPGYTDTFSVMVESKSMTVSVPSYDSSGNVIAAVLVHAPIDGANKPIMDGLYILLLSVLIALILSIFLAILLSRRFSRPIKIMNETTKKIADEDYDVKTDIHQDDEIGELAITIDKLSEKLLVAKDQRERLDKEKKEFYVEVSHELRTPVTVLRGSLESLNDGKIPQEKHQDYYQQMIKETEYIQHMLNDLLDYSKLNNPDFILEMDVINVSDVLSDAIRSMRKLSESKNIKLEVDNQIPIIKSTGNYEKLRQMFVIVLDNAIKFSSKDSTVFVSVEEVDTLYKIMIQDTGAGIDQEDLPYIFERYYRDNKKGNTSGTGIGLALTKEIAERHDIKIDVESDNLGTIFTFSIRKED